MHLITGYNETAHITSANDGDANATVLGTGKFVVNRRNKFSYEVVSNNSIKINSGIGYFNGRYFEIPSGGYETAEIDNGASGKSRIDLIVARYEKDAETGIESINLYTIKGTAATSKPTTPSYNSGNITDGVTIADFPLYQVLIDGLTVTDVTKLFTTKDNLSDIVSDISDLVDSRYEAITGGGVAVGIAKKVGTSTVGSGTKPVYVNSGSVTASSSTVGGAGVPVYMKNGTLTACTVSSIVPTSGDTTPALVSAAGIATAFDGMLDKVTNLITVKYHTKTGSVTLTGSKVATKTLTLSTKTVGIVSMTAGLAEIRSFSFNSSTGVLTVELYSSEGIGGTVTLEVIYTTLGA